MWSLCSDRLRRSWTVTSRISCFVVMVMVVFRFVGSSVVRCVIFEFSRRPLTREGVREVTSRLDFSSMVYVLPVGTLYVTLYLLWSYIYVFNCISFFPKKSSNKCRVLWVEIGMDLIVIFDLQVFEQSHFVCRKISSTFR